MVLLNIVLQSKHWAITLKEEISSTSSQVKWVLSKIRDENGKENAKMFS